MSDTRLERLISSSNPEPLALYDDVVQREQWATALVAALDEHLASPEARRWSVEDQLVLHQGERQLLVEDLAINEGLTTLYRTLSADSPDRTEPLLVRTALLHWTVLLRRQSMQSLHTQVEGLQDDPDCRGDVILDQLLLRYFDRLFEQRRGARREVESIRALADLARQSGCLGAQQSARLASDLYWSFVELRSFLRLNGLEPLLPYVAQAGAGPLLLFHDVEKFRGPQAPLARWFLANYTWLVDGVTTGRIPLVWHGLWLYDRRSGHLLGYHHTAEPKDENDVDLATFFASIVSRENLGRYDCSFGEMIERGAALQGYFCSGSLCSPVHDPRLPSGGLAGIAENPLLRAPPGVLLSALGLSGDAVKAAICEAPGGSGSTGGGGGDAGEGACGTGITGAGRGWAADTMRCLTQQIVRPEQKGLRCVAEALGLCASPANKIAKNLQHTVFAGVRTGDRCLLSATTGELREREEVEAAKKEAEQKTDEALRALKALEDAETRNKKNEKNLEDALAKLEEAREARDAAKEADLERIVGALDNMRESTKQEAEELREHFENAVDEMEEADLEYLKVRGIQEGASPVSPPPGLTRGCPPETPECGTDACTGMSQAMMKTMQCLEQATREEDLKTLDRQPGFVDPSPLDDPQSPSWLKCLNSFEDVSTAVQKQCWAYDCGPENTTTLGAQGGCSCGPPATTGDPGRHMAGMCGHMRCGDGVPTVQNGMCTCSGVGGTFGDGPVGPTPERPLVTSAPPLFSEVRVRNTFPFGGPFTGTPHMPPGGLP